MDVTVFRGTISILLDYLRCYIEKRIKEQDFFAENSSVNQKQMQDKTQSVKGHALY